MPETKISFSVKNKVDESIQDIDVMRRLNGSEMKLKDTDEKDIINLAFKEPPGTEIELRFTQPKGNPDYQDLDIHFSIPKKDEQLKINYAAYTRVDLKDLHAGNIRVGVGWVY